MPQSLGVRIRQRRKALGLTQEELAQRANCARATIRKLETDERRPSPELAACLVEALDLHDAERDTFLQDTRPAQPQVHASPKPEVLAAHMPPRRDHLWGRDQLRAVICESLLKPDLRLLTLHGPGGVGKTQLALHAAADLAGDVADDVYAIGLAAAATADAAAITVTQALGARDAYTGSALAHLIHALRERDALLVLDNLEQIPDIGGYLSELLTACPRVKVLATSRVLLRAPEERALAVPPLDLPDDHLPDHTTIAATPAVALFVERANISAPGFALTERNAQVVAAICAHADGLPLAIELLAARSRLLPPAALLARLEGASGHTPLSLAQRRDAALPDRHQTLHNVLDWSYRLLEPTSQQLFARLGVFAEGCMLAAAQVVCGLEETSSVRIAAKLDLLTDGSLLQRVNSGDEPRWNMLTLVREYAQERLEASGETEFVRKQHCDYFLALAEMAEPHLLGAGQRVWMNRLEQEHANILAALEWAWKQGHVERAGRIAGAVWRFWWIGGQFNEGRAWMQRVLEAETVLPPVVRAVILNGVGAIANNQNDHQAARAFHERALLLRREIGDQVGVARSLGNLGNVARQLGDQDNARTYYAESLQIFRELGETWGVATSLLNLGTLLNEPHELAEKQQVYAESLHLYYSLGDNHGAGIALANLGEVALRRGDYQEAEWMYREAIALRREMRNLEGVAYCLMMLGVVAIEQGQTEHGVRLLGADESIRAEAQVPVASVHRAEYQHYIALARSRLDQATFVAAWAEGRAMDLQRASDYALDGNS